MTQRLPSKGIGEGGGGKGADQAHLKHLLAVAVVTYAPPLPLLFKFYVTCILTKLRDVEYSRIDVLKTHHDFVHEHQISNNVCFN